MTDENYEARAQAHLASIKRDMKASMEDAVVRAMHKVMAEFEAKSDERLMEDWGPGPHEHHSLPAREPEQPAQQEPVAKPHEQEPIAYLHQCGKKPELKELSFKKNEPLLAAKGYKAIPLTSPQPAQHEPVAWEGKTKVGLPTGAHRLIFSDRVRADEWMSGFVDGHAWLEPLTYTSPPAQRKPLTHEQRVDLLAKFEAHKHEWHAPAILIDMVEAAHGIKGDA